MLKKLNHRKNLEKVPKCFFLDNLILVELTLLQYSIVQ